MSLCSSCGVLVWSHSVCAKRAFFTHFRKWQFLRTRAFDHAVFFCVFFFCSRSDYDKPLKCFDALFRSWKWLVAIVNCPEMNINQKQTNKQTNERYYTLETERAWIPGNTIRRNVGHIYVYKSHALLRHRCIFQRLSEPSAKAGSHIIISSLNWVSQHFLTSVTLVYQFLCPNCLLFLRNVQFQ